MKRTTLTAIALLLSTGFAFAGPGAEPPKGSQDPDPSGRPGKVLSEADCEKAWEMASPDGDTLSEDKATPFILNFQMVDFSEDGTISYEEWTAGCAKGWVSADAASEKDMEESPADSDKKEM